MKRLLVIFLLLGTLASYEQSRVSAQQSVEVTIDSSLLPNVATLGEQVLLTITVRHSQNLLISIGELTRVSDIDLSLIEAKLPIFDNPLNGGTDGMATTSFEFMITAYQLGDLQAGDIVISWLASDGSTGAASVKPPVLHIEPVRIQGDAQLRPLRSQLLNGEPPVWWQRSEMIIASIALFTLTILIIAWYRSRVKEANSSLASERNQFEDDARGRLDALQTYHLLDDETYRYFYSELATVIRSYIEIRFGFNATALTTSELRERLNTAGVGRWQARLIDGLLERCDNSVYARSHPDPASANHDLTVAYEIIELSRSGTHPPFKAVRK